MKIKCVVGGKEYQSINECWVDNHHKTNCSYGMFYKLIKSGMTAEKALVESLKVNSSSGRSLRKNPIEITRRKFYFKVEDTQYYTLKDIGEAYDIPLNTIYKRYSRGKRDDELIPEKKRKNYVKLKPKKKEEKYKFFINEVGYKSHADACRRHNVLKITYRKRLIYGDTQAQALGIEKRVDGRENPKKRKKHNLIKVKAYGKIYKSISQLAKTFNLPVEMVRKRIQKGNSPEEAIKEKKQKGKKVILEGKTYKSITEAAQKYNLTPENVRQKILNGLTVEQALGLESYKTKHTIKYKGKIYKSLIDLSKQIDFPYRLLKTRMNHGGMSVVEAIKLGKKNILNQGRYNLSIFKKNPKLSSTISFLYLVSLVIDGQIKYKIGITKNTVKSRITSEGFKYNIIKTVKLKLVDSFKVEQKLLKKYSSYRDKFIKSKDLDGYTEIFNFPNHIVDEIKNGWTKL